MNLSDVTIGITSFLRPGYLMEAVAGVKEYFPECAVLVADDSDSIPWIEGTSVVMLPFDSGLSKKRNALVQRTKTKYFLLGTDDFIFDKRARNGVEKMRQVLEDYPHIDVAAGRVNNKVYEGNLEYVPGSHIKEIYYDGLENWSLETFNEETRVFSADITANYFLAKTNSIVPWEESLKIGGEHVMWFLKMSGEDRVIDWVPGADIYTQMYNPNKQDPRYNAFRARAIQGHEQMKKLLNIKKYIDFNGVES